MPKTPNFFGTFDATTHSGPWRYLQGVPLVLYGPGYIRAVGNVTPAREVTLADLAPTLAELLRTPWPASRGGAPINETLVPAAQRDGVPRLVVVVVWDGGGWNVLERWPGAWPHLRRLMSRGASVTNAIVGSSPSVTPAIHATIGTGTFPNQHGIVDIFLRDGPDVVGSWDSASPTYLETPTLADLYDRKTANEARVGMVAEKGWHLGMMGHGAGVAGGDKDVAAMGDVAGKLYTSERFYSLPSYLETVPGLEDDVRTVDLADGRLDATWLGHSSLDDAEAIRLSPVWLLYQNRLIRALVERAGFGSDRVADLLFTNYKQIDLIGHAWNMVEPEVRDAVHYSDQALGELTSYLDRTVGRGEWVLAVTADHGQTPDADTTRAWPIDINELMRDIASGFGMNADELFQQNRPGALWVDARALAQKGLSLKRVSARIVRYRMSENVTDGLEVPQEYDGRMHERLFSAAFPYRWITAVWKCATGAGEAHLRSPPASRVAAARLTDETEAME